MQRLQFRLQEHRKGIIIKFAYADPPYLGLAKKIYGRKHPDAGAYDMLEKHVELIEILCRDFSDGWALSLHTPSLKTILNICPDDVRVMAWCKPWAPFRPGLKTAHYAWEPVIVRGGRPITERLHTVRDYTITPMVLGCAKESFGKGTKPEGFVKWILDVLNAQIDDEIVDMFPGSGGVLAFINKWKQQRTFCFR